MGITKTAFVGGETQEGGKNVAKHDKAHKGEESKVHLSGLKGGQRVKMVSEETQDIKIQGDKDIKSETTQKKVKAERVRGKKYVDAKKKFDGTKTYSAPEAIKWVKETSYSKFEGTMELHMTVKKTGLSAQVALPHQAGKQKRVEIASDATIEKLKTGKIDFDILVATAQMMPKLVPFARLLGPKGLMPNPKNGTLVPDEKKAKGFSTGTVTLKTEKEAPLIHTIIGKVGQDAKELEANLEAILKVFGGSKQIEKAFIKATMSPAVKVKV